MKRYLHRIRFVNASCYEDILDEIGDDLEEDTAQNVAICFATTDIFNVLSDKRAEIFSRKIKILFENSVVHCVDKPYDNIFKTIQEFAGAIKEHYQVVLGFSDEIDGIKLETEHTFFYY